MTLVIALKCMFNTGEAVLVSSDSKATTPIGIAYEVKKIHPILLDDKPVAIASGAGDVSLVKWGFEVAEDILLDCASQEYPVKSLNFRNAIREIEYRFVKRFSDLEVWG